MASMPTARRLLRAGFLTLALWLLVGSAIGVASADDGEGASFVMPAVQLGDRVVYDQVATDDEGTDRTPLMVSWEQREPLLLQDGLWHAIDSLHYDLGDLAHLDESETLDVALVEGIRDYEAGTHRMQAISVEVLGSGEQGAAFVGPFQLQSVSFDADVGMTQFIPPPFNSEEIPDCLFGGLWAGQEIKADGELTLPPCASPAWYLAGMTFQGMGEESVDGVPALRFHGVLQRNGYTPIAEADLWLSPAAPYPLRVVGEGRLRGESESLELMMTGFDAGSAPRVVVPPWPAAPQPELRRTPFTGMLPFDDSDTGLPFPLSRAVGSARNDADVTVYLTNHPEAYVVAADYNEVTTTVGAVGQPQRTWNFVLADTTSAGLAVTVTQDQAGGDAVPTPLGPLLRVDRVDSTDFVDGDAPKRSDLPREMPTMGSLLRRWAWQRDAADDGGFWGYDLRIATEEAEELFAGGHLVMVGHVDATMTPGVGADGAVLDTAAGLDFAAYDLDGQVWMLLGAQGNESKVVGPGGATPPSASGTAPLAASIAPTSWVPSAAQAAGAGVVALVVGALYFLWPKLKALAFAGLFSRLLPAQLLDHPGRARLLEVIRAEPGIHFQELVRRSGLASGTAVHHLNKLARGGLIACRPLGRYTCYFPGASPDRQSLLAAPLLRSDGARLVYETIVGSPHLSGLELAERTGLQKSTVNYHVQRLTEAGLVAAQRDGRAVRLRAAGTASAATPAA